MKIEYIREVPFQIYGCKLYSVKSEGIFNECEVREYNDWIIVIVSGDYEGRYYYKEFKIDPGFFKSQQIENVLAYCVTETRKEVYPLK